MPTKALESREVIQARIEELTEAARRHCRYCANDIPAKWDVAEGRIHQGWDGIEWGWITFNRCWAQGEYRRISELEKQLNELNDK